MRNAEKNDDKLLVFCRCCCWGGNEMRLEIFIFHRFAWLLKAYFLSVLHFGLSELLHSAFTVLKYVLVENSFEALLQI